MALYVGGDHISRGRSVATADQAKSVRAAGKCDAAGPRREKMV